MALSEDLAWFWLVLNFMLLLKSAPPDLEVFFILSFFTNQNVLIVVLISPMAVLKFTCRYPKLFPYLWDCTNKSWTNVWSHFGLFVISQSVLSENYNNHQRQINHCWTKLWQCLAIVQIHRVESAAAMVLWNIFLGSLIYGCVNHYWTYDVMFMAVATIFQF